MVNPRLKAIVKGLPPVIRDPLFRFRVSHTARTVIALPGLVRFHAAARHKPTYVFDISSQMGMGAMLSHAIRVLKLAESEGLRVRIAFTNPLYATQPGSDYFQDFLTQRDAPAPGKAPVRIVVHSERDYEVLSKSTTPTLAEAKALFDRHLGFSPAVERALDQELRRLGPLDQVIGIHFRGTDKHMEALPASWTAMRDAIADAIARTGWTKLFIATDEIAFEAFITEQFPECTVLRYSHEELTREAGVPVHFGKGDGLAKGIEAMLLMLLLARCGHLVRTASYLSSWSQILSPQTPTFRVNPMGLYRPRFPDKELAEAARYALIGGL